MSVKEKPLTARQRSGSKISETMATIVADPGGSPRWPPVGGPREGAAAKSAGDLGERADDEVGPGVIDCENFHKPAVRRRAGIKRRNGQQRLALRSGEALEVRKQRGAERVQRGERPTSRQLRHARDLGASTLWSAVGPAAQMRLWLGQSPRTVRTTG